MKEYHVNLIVRIILFLLLFAGINNIILSSYRAAFSCLFFGALTAYIYYNKQDRVMKVWKKVPLFYMVMYRKTWGIEAMDKIANMFPRTMRFLALFGVIIGFIGMAFISVMLVYMLSQQFIADDAPAGAGLVLPFEGPGPLKDVVYSVPIEMWILSIIIIAFVHEYAHGIVARLHKIKVKKSGFAFLGIGLPLVPAAFVEPDDKDLNKRPLRQKLEVFAAGPLSNILLAFLIVLPLILAMSSFAADITQFDGILIVSHDNETSPIKDAGIPIGTLMTGFDGETFENREEFRSAIAAKKPGDVVQVMTNESTTYEFTVGAHPDDESKPYMGIRLIDERSFTQEAKASYPAWFFVFFAWLAQFLYFLFELNLGIGLFNLLPFGPLDGGQMTFATLKKYFSKQKATKYFVNISMIFFAVIILTLLTPILKALL